ncbi:restriction endonuclease subunit S [Tabrizicola sp. YIM 78059]|uniref:restriction endonuclease subunit S n=1 Tax=Tabrizicola sp. YIM 78059 TaxID=2529861 RepID=UPI0010AAD63F|nr:restriction endonuclease subunit S [Tabrizicola sp. YIM 78059]
MSAGWKETEIGPVPEDWEVVTLGERGNFSKGGGVRKDQANSGTLPCIRYGELYTNHHEIIRSFPTRISPEVASSARRIRSGDVIFAGSGETKEEIGKCAVFIDDFEAYAGGDTIIFSPKRDDPVFLGYALNQPIAQRQKAAHGQGDAVVHVSARALASLTLPLPPLPEQRAIAGVLGDVDGLIGALAGLIGKRRDLAAAARARLLTGQTRLPGFTAPWQTRRLGEVVSVRNEKVASSRFEKGQPCIELEHIEPETGRVIGAAASGSWGVKQRFRRGDVLFGRLRAYLRKYWLADCDGYCSTEIWPIISKPGTLDVRFAYFTLQRSEVIDAASQAYGTHMPRSDWSVIAKLEIPLPDLAEQTAIAAVLSDMEAGIAALEARLAKARALKQALMQALLTGRRRLPLPPLQSEPAHA